MKRYKQKRNDTCRSLASVTQLVNCVRSSDRVPQQLRLKVATASCLVSCHLSKLRVLRVILYSLIMVIVRFSLCLSIICCVLVILVVFGFYLVSLLVAFMFLNFFSL
eukprot:Gregarina_sp_Pseudo_9__4482@NODE_4648_length_392_cov_69_422096_g3381_i1_p1_GENE_NODE_4648_length_392_cov_69_422096_g3381_i1NODE_4648_length_392_cov_69_422096_g3381_i1_p1_ORF_typecomplete_len107_score3_08DUF1700/PF08006_11/0_00078LMBR1/PF04791_16/0_078_NODE_4648_length_392_cov_69_422096_g3381_i16326